MNTKAIHLSLLPLALLICLAFACLTAISQADVVRLLNGDKLTGKVTAFDAQSTTINSPLSNKPLQVRASSIKKINFVNNSTPEHFHSESITLVNGDILPCRIISMDTENLNISTWYAGDFKIAKQNIQTLYFGLSRENNIYLGGAPVSDWGTSTGRWLLSNDTYSCKGAGVLAHELDMPDNIRIRYRLAWKDTPNFVFRFCGESDAANTKQLTYEFTFNSAGIQMGRYLKQEQYASIGNISLLPHDIPHNTLSLDFRLNRKKRTLALYINDKRIATWHDSFPPPQGNYIIFNNRSSKGNACIISDIHVSEWTDGTSTRNFTEIASSKSDLLIDTQKDKLSGDILGIIQKPENKRIIQFAQKHNTKPLMVPSHRVSLLYFAHPDPENTYKKAQLTAQLHDQGSIQLLKPQLNNGEITAQHPILGSYTLKSKAISHISRNTTLNQ